MKWKFSGKSILAFGASVLGVIFALVRRRVSIRISFAQTGFNVSSRYRYFTDEEAKGAEPELMAKLDMARKIAGIPFHLTSVLRRVEHNAAIGGLPDSAHLPNIRGLSYAADIFCDNSANRWRIVFALKEAGFTRIVQELLHIHADIDPGKPQYVLAIVHKP